jgi:ribonuclease HII
MSLLIQQYSPDIAYIEALERNASLFSQKLQKILGQTTTNIVAESKADDRYPVVASASILAKVERDHAIDELKEKWGDFGSGYPSDSKTIRFLRQIYQKDKTFPPCVRQTWGTIRKIVVGEQGSFDL